MKRACFFDAVKLQWGYAMGQDDYSVKNIALMLLLYPLLKAWFVLRHPAVFIPGLTGIGVIIGWMLWG
jgi:hypothetical protein